MTTASQETYGPDGRPIDGPRTTAAEYAEEIAEARARLASRGLEISPSQWRAAAFIEGDLYSEAIRGARAMRLRLLYNTPRSIVPMGRPDLELSAGSPIGWAQRD